MSMVREDKSAVSESGVDGDEIEGVDKFKYMKVMASGFWGIRVEMTYSLLEGRKVWGMMGRSWNENINSNVRL